MKNFRYKTTFASKVRCLIDEEKDKILSQASLANLKSIIPESVRNQLTLLPIAFNSCTVNLGNKNGAVIGTKTGLEIYKQFINLPINLDHSRSASYGHIVNASFSEFDINYATGSGSKILDLASIKDTNDPFNLALAGVLYKLYATELCEAIEDSNDPNSSKYLEISASWELLYDEFDLAVGSKYLKDCEIISDSNKKEEYDKYLLHNGGSGKLPDGRPVFVLLKNEVVPGGIGLTTAPAAEVKGIYVDSEKTKISTTSSKSSTYNCPECGEELDMSSKNAYYLEDDEEIECAKCKEKSMGKKWKSKADIIINVKDMTKGGIVKSDENIILLAENELVFNKNIKKSEISNSQSQKLSVNKENIINKSDKIMIKNKQDITDSNLKEATASQVLTVLDEEIKKISDKYVEEKDKISNELKASNDKLAETEKKIKETEDKLTKIQENLTKLVEANQKREEEEIFNTRMNYFDQEYDLSEEKTRNIVARKIKNVKTEDEYKEQKEEIELLLAAKKKSGKVFDKKTMKWVDPKEVEDEKKEKEAKASVDTKEEKKEELNPQDVVDDAIDKGEKTKAAVAATTAPTETQADKWSKAFGIDNWELDKRAFRK